MTVVGREKWNWHHRDQMRPLVDWVIRHARIGGAMTVLDLGCGTGQPAIPIAERLRSGRVVGIDNDAEMLAACRRLARIAGVENLELREMDMHSLAFSDRTFDAVTCCSALMVARDPVRVMSEVRRVLKPEGRFAITVWDEPARNPLFTSVLGALPVAPPDPRAPGPFRLSAHGELQSVLRAAGFPDFTIENVPIVFESASPDDHVTMVCETMPIVERALAGKTDEEIAKVRQAMLAAIQPYVENGRVRIGCMPLCATAAR